MRLLRLDPHPAGELDGVFDAEALILCVPPTPFDDYVGSVGAAAREAFDGGVPRLVFTSSTSVYPSRRPPLREVPVTETDAPVGVDRLPAELGSRGRRMRAAEAAVRAAHPGATILRLGGLRGPDRSPARFLAGRRGVDGPDAPVNLVHRHDVVAVVQALLTEPNEGALRGEVFNVVAPGHPARGDYYPAAARSAGLEPPIFASAPPEGSPGKRVSSAKLRAALGLEFRSPTEVPAAP